MNILYALSRITGDSPLSLSRHGYRPHLSISKQHLGTDGLIACTGCVPTGEKFRSGGS